MTTTYDSTTTTYDDPVTTYDGALFSESFPSVEARIGWRPEQFNRVTNPGFETNTTGWSVSAGINGAGTSIVRTGADAHSGADSASMLTPATALTGVNYDFGSQAFYAVDTYYSVYRCVVWLKWQAGTKLARLIFGSEGTSSDRASRDVMLTTEWQPFSVDWAPSATRTDVQLAIVNVPAAAMQVRIDDAAVWLRDAMTQVENGYFTTNATGWLVTASINAAATSITRRTSGGYYGDECGRLVTTSTNGSGTNWQFGTAKYTSGRTYRARVWAKSISGSTSARLRLGSIGTAADRGDASITLTTDWAAYTVDWTPSGDRTDAEIAITNGSAAVVTADIDGVEVYEALDDISADAFGVNGAQNLDFGRGAAFDGSGQALGYANMRVFNAMKGGKYTPDNSDVTGVLYGLLTVGRRVLIRAEYDGVPYPLFYGSVRRFIGLPMELACEIHCEDPLYDLRRIRWHRHHTLFSAHDARVFALNQSTIYNYTTENGPIERLSVWKGTDYTDILSYLETLNKATGSIHFVKPSVYASIGWQLVMRDRTVHSDASTPAETWDDDLADLSGYDVTDEALVNRQRVIVNAYELGIQRILWSAYQPETHSVIDDQDGKFYINDPTFSGESPIETMPLTVPANTVRELHFTFSPACSGPSFVVDYTTSSCTETTDVGPGWAILTLAAGASDVVIKDIILYGSILRPMSLKPEDASDQEAIWLDQEHAGDDVDSPYVNHPGHAWGLAKYKIWRWRRGRARPSTMRHNQFPSQLEREVADRIGLNFGRLSLASKPFSIMSFATVVSQNARDWQTTYQVEELPATPSGGWFVLGTSSLDSTANLAN